MKVMGPYLALRFFALPLPLALINPAFYWTAVANLFLADTLSNIHSFIIIATNHCGDDMYKFENSCTLAAQARCSGPWCLLGWPVCLRLLRGFGGSIFDLS